TKISSTAISTWAISFWEHPTASICPFTNSRTVSSWSSAASMVSSAMFVPPSLVVVLQQQHGDVIRLFCTRSKSGNVIVEQPQPLVRGPVCHLRSVKKLFQPLFRVQVVLWIQRLCDSVGVEKQATPRRQSDLLLAVMHILHTRQHESPLAGQPVKGL